MKKRGAITILVLSAIAVLAQVLPAYAVAGPRIAPPWGNPGDPFIIIDPQKRMETGSVAIFVIADDPINMLFASLTCSGALKSECVTARGQLSDLIPSGDYDVVVETPRGERFEVGSFRVCVPTTGISGGCIDRDTPEGPPFR